MKAPSPARPERRGASSSPRIPLIALERLRRCLAARLEAPGATWDASWPVAVLRPLVHPVRRLQLPSTSVIGVGGATLGGDGKTPLVEALARALAAEGPAPRVVTSAHPSRPRCQRLAADADPRRVGDEAAWLAQRLEGVATVHVGPSRGRALATLTGSSPVLVDGLLQTQPRRLALALLAVDARQPWGSGRRFPFGDLRASPAQLLAATDQVVRLGLEDVDPYSVGGLFVARCITGARVLGGDREVSLAELRSARLGLSLAVARPERVEAALAAVGVVAREQRRAPDHGRPGIPSGRPLDAWLCTEKGARHLDARSLPAPVWVLQESLLVPQRLVDRCRQLRLEG